MRRGVVVLAAGAAVMLVAVGGFYAYAQREYTNCYATFKTEEAAERASDSMRDAGFDAESDSPGSVTFSSGETGADAREFRDEFREVLRREGARPLIPAAVASSGSSSSRELRGAGARRPHGGGGSQSLASGSS